MSKAGQQHIRTGSIGLGATPATVCQPKDALLALDFQADSELLDVLPIVDVRPEQPADLAGISQDAKQFRISDDCRVFTGRRFHGSKSSSSWVRRPVPANQVTAVGVCSN